MPCIGRCNSLRELSLSCLCSSHGGANDASFSDRLSAALQQLPLLTKLRLEAVCRQCAPGALCQLQGGALGQALRALTGLQALAVCGAAEALEVSAPERVLAVLPQLQQLTSLGLCFAGLQQAQVADLFPQLGALKECELLTPVLGETEEQAVAFKAKFPKVAFQVCGST